MRFKPTVNFGQLLIDFDAFWRQIRILQFRQRINNLYIIGYTISVVALLISLAIFFSFR